MQDCVMTALAQKTVVLVTHQVEFLTEASRILVSIYSEHNYSGLFYIKDPCVINCHLFYR